MGISLQVPTQIDQLANIAELVLLHSVGAYVPSEDMVLVMDVARFKYPPHVSLCCEDTPRPCLLLLVKEECGQTQHLFCVLIQWVPLELLWEAMLSINEWNGSFLCVRFHCL